jgi:hypothetical protein
LIIDGVALEIERIEHQRQLTSASARPTPENQEIRRLAAETAREAEQYRAELASRPAAAQKLRLRAVARLCVVGGLRAICPRFAIEVRSGSRKLQHQAYPIRGQPYRQLDDCDLRSWHV